MHDGAVEANRMPRTPLDVLAQQLVAMTAVEAWPVEALYRCVRQAAPFTTLTRRSFDGVLDMLSGRYPSDEFAELRPRLTWDRVNDVVTARQGAARQGSARHGMARRGAARSSTHGIARHSTASRREAW